MKHINKYSKFKSYNESKYNDTQIEIIDIIQELIDDQKIRFGFNDHRQSGNFFMLRTKTADKPLYWNDISEYILRVIHYLGDKIFSVRIRKHPNYREVLSVFPSEPNYIDITVDENTKIDFGLWSIVIRWN